VRMLVIGVFCEKKNVRITFEECQKCAKCLPATIIKTLRIFERHTKQRNSYSVSEVVNCLRKSYFERKEPLQDQFYTLKSLLSMTRGKLFEGLLDSTRWQELDGSLEFDIDGENVKIMGRIDAYDPDKLEIIELKSTKISDHTRLPRAKNELQLQCYGTIFKSIFGVKELTLVYVDMDVFEKYPVPLVDKTDWLKEQIQILHRAIRDSKSPNEEQSFECKFCPYNSKCSGLKQTVGYSQQIMLKNKLEYKSQNVKN